MRISDVARIIDETDFRIEPRQLVAVQCRALWHFNDKGAFSQPSPETVLERIALTDRFFLDRITVNWIRHNMTVYDRILRFARNKIGTGAMDEKIRLRVFESIIEAFPVLAMECARQMEGGHLGRFEFIGENDGDLPS